MTRMYTATQHACLNMKEYFKLMANKQCLTSQENETITNPVPFKKWAKLKKKKSNH